MKFNPLVFKFQSFVLNAAKIISQALPIIQRKYSSYCFRFAFPSKKISKVKTTSTLLVQCKLQLPTSWIPPNMYVETEEIGDYQCQANR